jgi:sugar phosphate isomerase/epimerase
MNLGISSLGYIIDLGLNGDFKQLSDLLFDATRLCLDFAEKNDIKTCELVLDPPEIFNENQRKKFIDLCNAYPNILKQVHGPFLDLCLCSHNKFISKATMDTYVESAKICKEINAKILTIHPGVANYLVKKLHRFNNQRLVEASKELLNKISNMDVICCIENMPKMVKIFLTINEIEAYLKNLNRNDIFLTWDTSHSWTCDVDVEELWEKFNKVIRNIHLVENDSKDSDYHPALGTGKVDFKSVFNIAQSYEYNGAFIVELSSAKDLPQSLNFIKKYI